MELTLPSDNYGGVIAVYTPGTGVLHAAAKLRNDGAAPTTVKLCTAIYDASWNEEHACTSVTLFPGVVTNAAVAHTITSPVVNGALWYVFPADGDSATIAVDDAYPGLRVELVP